MSIIIAVGGGYEESFNYNIDSINSNLNDDGLYIKWLWIKYC